MLSTIGRILQHGILHKMLPAAAMSRRAAFLNYTMMTQHRSAHSKKKDIKMCDMIVKIVPALDNNYMFVLIDPESKETAAIDPVDAPTILQSVQRSEGKLTKVIVTHHHADHAGGNRNIKKIWADGELEIIGGDERIECLSKMVKDGDTFKVGALEVCCIHTPCHTNGHICFDVKSPKGERVVFTGDTLFQGGCGQFFEGTAEDMYTALIDKLGALPFDTKVFPGHENAVDNLAFSLYVEPRNEQTQARLERVKKLRAKRKPTLPTTIGDEKLWNPFMRVEECGLIQHTGEDDPILVMDILRKQRNTFKL